jgi:hypothetical protein
VFVRLGVLGGAISLKISLKRLETWTSEQFSAVRVPTSSSYPRTKEHFRKLYNLIRYACRVLYNFRYNDPLVRNKTM